MAKRKKERERALWQRIAFAQQSRLPGSGFEPAALKELLELEATKPLRGGDADLPHNSIFGDSHKQGSMF